MKTENPIIQVEKIDNTTFKVTADKRVLTTHIVTVRSAYHLKLTGGRVTPEKLIEKSFEFLLDRESNTSILETFDLAVIGQYFPEYERVIKKLFR